MVLFYNLSVTQSETNNNILRSKQDERDERHIDLKKVSHHVYDIYHLSMKYILFLYHSWYIVKDEMSVIKLNKSCVTGVAWENHEGAHEDLNKPYAWAKYLETIFGRYPDAFFICLRRYNQWENYCKQKAWQNRSLNT